MKRSALGLVVLALCSVHPVAAAPKKGPCRLTLSACPQRGCEDPKTPAAFLNSQKRKRQPTGPLRRLTFEDFRSLQEQAEQLFNGKYHKLTKPDRVRLRNLAINGEKVGEGNLVEIIGFIAVKPPGTEPHANTSGESVNCRLTTAKNNDFHISVTPSPEVTEYRGIVVEMVPQQRSEKWAEARLAQVQTKRRMVRVRGLLFFDNHHVVNDDQNDNIKNQPKRMSLWEIHPVAEFDVCTKATCDPNGTGWKPLEEWQGENQP